MLAKLVELADKKDQVNIAFTKGKTDMYLLGIAPKNAGKDKLAPLVLKGTVDEINKQLDEKLPAYIEACTKKPEPPKEKKAPAKKKAASKKKEVIPEQQVCRVCGCTDTSPCPDGCSWTEKDLCSACVDKIPLKESDKEPEAQPTFTFDFG